MFSAVGQRFTISISHFKLVDEVKNILKTTVSLDTTRLSACVECTKAPADRDGCAKNKQPGLTEWGA